MNPKKYIFFLIAIIIGVCQSTISLAAVDQYKPAVVLVKIMRNATGQLVDAGTGTILSRDGWILTAKHIFRNYDRSQDTIFIHMLSPSNPGVKAHIDQCTDGLADSCLLLIPRLEITTRNITAIPATRCQTFSSDATVTLLGWPKAGSGGAYEQMTLSLSQDMSLVEVAGSNVNAFGFSPLASSGTSGGPVFDASDNVVGQVVGGDQGKTFVTGISSATLLLDKIGAPCTKSDASVNDNLMLKKVLAIDFRAVKAVTDQGFEDSPLAITVGHGFGNSGTADSMSLTVEDTSVEFAMDKPPAPIYYSFTSAYFVRLLAGVGGYYIADDIQPAQRISVPGQDIVDRQILHLGRSDLTWRKFITWFKSADKLNFRMTVRYQGSKHKEQICTFKTEEYVAMIKEELDENLRLPGYIYAECEKG